MAEQTGVKARVRHEQDRSYTVLVLGPAGEAEVGTTTETGQLRRLAVEGAARLLSVPLEQVVVELVVPRPPCGRDGQLVRITSRDVPEDHGALGQAHWFGAEGAWFVTVVGSGTGIVPTEGLDFAPQVGDLELAELTAYLERAGRKD
ncbi:hypothetical protein GTQ99_04745 [Kineococcus sp. T13]|uniref:hypothetical protein n=1 Tax=Kineococcus vitellinus TaxID=2696565 RepID=UPI001411C12F|nr:hypothetical protein [Kineococcus vitellinus]NAZ74732.1 hypothetical protein [Kineococcus vitellinus]